MTGPSALDRLSDDRPAPPSVPDLPFEATCLMCGETDTIRRTEQEYRRMKPMRCQRCGGRMFIVPEFERLGAHGLPEHIRAKASTKAKMA